MKNIDWILFISTFPLLGAGLITMKSLGDNAQIGGDYFFTRQIIWIAVAFIVFFALSFIDWRFLKKGEVLMLFYSIFTFLFIFLVVFGKETKGAASWFNIFALSIEPIEPFKILLILILAKYFSRRHIDIARFKHIFISAIYVLIPGIFVLLQPDFGSTIIICLIWFGMIMVSGVKKKHLLIVFLTGAVVFSGSWFFVLEPYQKDRITSFLNPLADIRGAGYNAYQSMIAVGSGQFAGKGIGYGTQSRLEFLPEHQTDFIFAAFVEEWGFVGTIFIFLFYGIVIWRILKNAMLGNGNFESFFGIGLAVFFMVHFFIHIGMNIGLLPITGTTLPFLSYGGSHMLTVFAGLGILMGMRRYRRTAYTENSTVEF